MLTNLPNRQCFTSDEGYQLSYRCAGDPSKPPLVIIHGAAGSSASWFYQYQAFANDYWIIAWDAPGYGHSTPLPRSVIDTQPVLTLFSQRLYALLTHLECTSFFCLGHSMGGIIATQLTTYPDLSIKHLILSCSHKGYGQPNQPGVSARFQKRIDELESSSLEEYAERRIGKLLPNTQNPEIQQVIKQAAMDISAEGIYAVGKMSDQSDVSEPLKHLHLPTTLISCSADKVIPSRLNKALHELIPTADCVTLEGLGHAPYAENQALYNQTIQAALTKHSTLNLNV